MADLHAVLTARIDEAEAFAKLLDEHLDGHERPYNPADPTDPVNVLRGLAEDRDILRRHVPSEFVTVWEHGARHPPCTHGFADEEDELPVDAVRWDRCPELLSLARRHGVSVDHD